MKTIDVGFAKEYFGKYGYQFVISADLNVHGHHNGGGKWIGARLGKPNLRAGGELIESFEL